MRKNKGNRQNVKLLVRLMLIVSALLVLVAAGLWADMYRFARRPAGSFDTPFVIDIPARSTFSQLAAMLHQNHVINSAWRFKLLARVRSEDKRLKAGEYALTASMTPVQILDTLINGKVVLHRLLIPEGYTAEQIAAELARTQLTDAQRFLTLAHNPEVAAELGCQGDSLEGYLFPDTYYFPKNSTPRDIIKTMVAHFFLNFTQLWRERAQELGLTPHQVVTLASIIEKETGAAGERALVASVFHNRLKKKMRLESDPTVIYGIAKFDGNLTRSQLRAETPFNTYRIEGLPPGPIANPGKASLQAALFPAQTNFLYFVSRGDGTHYFSATLQEHNQAVRRYQLHQ